MFCIFILCYFLTLLVIDASNSVYEPSFDLKLFSANILYNIPNVTSNFTKTVVKKNKERTNI